MALDRVAADDGGVARGEALGDAGLLDHALAAPTTEVPVPEPGGWVLSVVAFDAATGKDKWQGKVFVPDRNASYYSTIKQINANQLKISGCILGGLLCKSQVWSRI